VGYYGGRSEAKRCHDQLTRAAGSVALAHHLKKIFQYRGM
jgi:hypothetical protein